MISADNAGDNTLDETYSYSLTSNLLSDGAGTLTWNAPTVCRASQNGATVTLAYGPDGAQVKKSWDFATLSRSQCRD